MATELLSRDFQGKSRRSFQRTVSFVPCISRQTYYRNSQTFAENGHIMLSQRFLMFQNLHLQLEINDELVSENNVSSQRGLTILLTQFVLICGNCIK